MKRILIPAFFLCVLLLSFMGCSSEASNNQQYDLVTKDEDASDNHEYANQPKYEAKADGVVDKDEIKVVFDTQPRFTSTWAKTTDYFFFTFEGNFRPDAEFALYRLPLDYITGGSRIDLPSEGLIQIVGFNEEDLFISVREDFDWRVRNYNIYRFSLSTQEIELINSGVYCGVPFFHSASGSILFTHTDFEEGLVWLEYLRLDSGERNVFTRFESKNFDSVSTGWWHIEGDGNAVFINSGWGGTDANSDFILIDSDLNAQQIERSQITNAPFYTLRTEPENLAEEFILGLETMFHSVDFNSFATIGDWVYYLWSGEGWGWFGNDLYRINIDGTQNTLLHSGLYASRLFNINDMLFATIVPQPMQADDSVWQQAVMLSEDGDIYKVLGGGWHGHNAGFSIRQLADIDVVLIMQFNFFTIDGLVRAVYCTATETLFSLEVQ
ncbi:MAG: hypothetical protein FWD97_00970 [Defluviitaleaceae bacterium]|nr:hypothetical protein [Defluviitaleaceae bacterium]